MMTPEEIKNDTMEQWIDRNVHKNKGNPNLKSVKAHKFVPCRFGNPDVPSKYNPSYRGINEDNQIPDPDNYEIKHKIEIINYEVLFNGVPIARAPEPFTGKLKGKSQWTPARRISFCKAVIWGIIPSETRVYQKDTNGKMCTQTIPDDSELRRYIALYPAVLDNQCDDVKEEMMDKIAINALPGIIAISAPVVPVVEDLVLPEHLNAYTPEGITGYPSAEVVEDLLLRHSINYEVEIEEIESTLIEGLYDMIDNRDHRCDRDNYPEETAQMYDLVYPAVHPVIVRSWTHGCMKITEEMISA